MMITQVNLEKRCKAFWILNLWCAISGNQVECLVAFERRDISEVDDELEEDSR